MVLDIGTNNVIYVIEITDGPYYLLYVRYWNVDSNVLLFPVVLFPSFFPSMSFVLIGAQSLALISYYDCDNMSIPKKDRYMFGILCVVFKYKCMQLNYYKLKHNYR